MGGGSSPCASCKLLRRRCAKDCIFAPYFPSDDPHKFAIVHKVFGASNVSKMLQELPVHQRADAVSSLVYEANARARDPVYGCVGAITYLQDQVAQLQMQLAVAQAEILCIQMHQDQLDQDQPPVYLHQSPIVGAHHPFSLLMHEDQASACSDDNNNNNNNNNKSFLIQNNQLLNFSASSGNHVLYQEQSFKKEAIYGHDMVS